MEQAGMMLVTAVYLAFLLDNILLTVVVPIIPDYLYSTDLMRLLLNYRENSTSTAATPAPHSENARVAVLLSSKAIVQLLTNPLVGIAVARVGCCLPLMIGSICLLISVTRAEDYQWLFIARSLHGVASSCIGVAGMSAIAERFSCEKSRSHAMGAVLGSGALGVLLGYPLGGLLYDWFNKSAPFIVLAVLTAMLTGFQCVFLEMKQVETQVVSDTTSVKDLLSDRHILVAAGAIFISTSTMAVLEPCLPLWLMETIHPQKWQLGTVFIPDSLGYFVGTNCFGALAYQKGRGRMASAAIVLVGISAVMVPCAHSVPQLSVPHLGMGLGIGVVDAALVPLLAHLADAKTQEHHTGHYGGVYALQQAAVSMAYALGPLAGGAAVRFVGFSWLMHIVGTLNLLYCPLLVSLCRISPPAANEDPDQLNILGPTPALTYDTYQTSLAYQRFHDADQDSD